MEDIILECDCCTSNENIIICPLDNCIYPLCEDCYKKIFNNNDKCPCCRRFIKPESILEINLEPDLEIIRNNTYYSIFPTNSICLICLNNDVLSKIKKFLYSFLSYTISFIFMLFIIILLSIFFRFITIIFSIGASDFFCISKGDYAFLYYFLYSIIGCFITSFILGIFVSILQSR